MTRVAIALLVATSACFAATDDELRKAARDPIQLARFIASHAQFDWRVLYNELGIPGTDMAKCGDSVCTTELITILNPDQTILLVQNDSSPVDLYIRYLNRKFAGVHCAYIRNYPRRHQVARIARKPYLRVSSQGASGSGVGSEVETWLDLSGTEFQPVFTMIPQGHDSRLQGIGRKLTEQAAFRNGEIQLVGIMSFETPNGTALGTLTYTQSYSQTSGNGPFRYRRGSIPEAERDALSDMNEGPSNEALLRYCMRSLRQIASGGGDEDREWLSKMLSRLPLTAEVQSLKATFRK